jgi:hypothetical protein
LVERENEMFENFNYAESGCKHVESLRIVAHPSAKKAGKLMLD